MTPAALPYRPGRLTLLLLLLALPPVSPPASFGLSLAYGGGASLNFSPVTFNGTYSSAASQVTSPVSATSLQFFDATYLVAQVGYFLNRASTEPTAVSTPTAFASVLTGLSLGISARLPITIGPVAVFPILGVEYVLNLSWTDDKGNNLKSAMSAPASALDELWVKGGVGVDLFFGNFFLRPVVLGAFKPFGAAAVTAGHPTGALSLSSAFYAVDVFLLFGYRL